MSKLLLHGILQQQLNQQSSGVDNGWLVTGADSNFLGSYLPVGIENGKTLYRLKADYELYWRSNNIWVIGSVVGEGVAYYGTGATLPANPWTSIGPPGTPVFTAI